MIPRGYSLPLGGIVCGRLTDFMVNFRQAELVSNLNCRAKFLMLTTNQNRQRSTGYSLDPNIHCRNGNLITGIGGTGGIGAVGGTPVIAGGTGIGGIGGSAGIIGPNYPNNPLGNPNGPYQLPNQNQQLVQLPNNGFRPDGSNALLIDNRLPPTYPNDPLSNNLGGNPGILGNPGVLNRNPGQFSGQYNLQASSPNLQTLPNYPQPNYQASVLANRMPGQPPIYEPEQFQGNRPVTGQTVRFGWPGTPLFRTPTNSQSLGTQNEPVDPHYNQPKFSMLNRPTERQASFSTNRLTEFPQQPNPSPGKHVKHIKADFHKEQRCIKNEKRKIKTRF